MRQPLAVHGAVLAGIAVFAFILAVAWPAEAEVRKTAAAGVLLCAVSGVGSLELKRRTKTVQQGLLAVVVVFFARAVMAVLGATWAIRAGAGVMPFVYGFFGTYFPLQWVEISYLIAEDKRRKAKS